MLSQLILDIRLSSIHLECFHLELDLILPRRLVADSAKHRTVLWCRRVALQIIKNAAASARRTFAFGLGLVNPQRSNGVYGSGGEEDDVVLYAEMTLFGILFDPDPPSASISVEFFVSIQCESLHMSNHEKE